MEFNQVLEGENLTRKVGGFVTFFPKELNVRSGLTTGVNIPKNLTLTCFP
jgi:hypothetical protein